MLINYKFANGETTEIEVSEEWGAFVLNLDRLDYNSDQRETRRHCSLEAFNLNDAYFSSDVNVEDDFMELGFADGVLEDSKRQQATPTYAFSRRAVTNSLLDKVKPKAVPEPAPQGVSADVAKATPADWLEKRLNLILH